jgi:hypothetical protein
MSMEEFLFGGSLITPLLTIVALAFFASRSWQPAYKPVKVPIARRPSNQAYTSRPDYILE